MSVPIIASVYALAGNGRSYNGVAMPYTLGRQGVNLFDVTSGRNGSCRRSYLCTAGRAPTARPASARRSGSAPSDRRPDNALNQ